MRREVHGVSGVSGRDFDSQHGPGGCCANGNSRNCTRRRCRSGELESLRSMGIEESLVRNALISTCRTFRICNVSRALEREEKSGACVFVFGFADRAQGCGSAGDGFCAACCVKCRT